MIKAFDENNTILFNFGTSANRTPNFQFQNLNPTTMNTVLPTSMSYEPMHLYYTLKPYIFHPVMYPFSSIICTKISI